MQLCTRQRSILIWILHIALSDSFIMWVCVNVCVVCSTIFFLFSSGVLCFIPFSHSLCRRYGIYFSVKIYKVLSTQWLLSTVRRTHARSVFTLWTHHENILHIFFSRRVNVVDSFLLSRILRTILCDDECM